MACWPAVFALLRLCWSCLVLFVIGAVNMPCSVAQVSPLLACFALRSGRHWRERHEEAADPPAQPDESVGGVAAVRFCSLLVPRWASAGPCLNAARRDALDSPGFAAACVARFAATKSFLCSCPSPLGFFAAPAEFILASASNLVTHLRRSTKDDWIVWMRGFSIELLKVRHRLLMALLRCWRERCASVCVSARLGSAQSIGGGGGHVLPRLRSCASVIVFGAV
jgi:hypothetical protein